MGDHKQRRHAGRRTVGVRDLKTHAPRIVRQVRETHASYLVTHRGQAVAVLLPVGGEDEATPGDEAAAAWAAFLRAGRRLERRFKSGGVRLLSGMRR